MSMSEQRLTRTESHCIQWLMNAMSSFRYAADDLKERLESVPDGPGRIRELNEFSGKLLEDIADTIPEKQKRHLVNLARDMEVRLVPKLTPRNVTVVLTKEEATELVDAAQERCKHCAEFAEESEKCRLRGILEVVVPLEDYTGLICPYSKAEWEDT
jgi:hypothetical protein